MNGNWLSLRSNKHRKFVGFIITCFLIGFGSIILLNMPYLKDEQELGGYITFPSAYNTMNDVMINATINHGTIENLTIADEECLNITVNSQASIEFGWQLIYISDAYTNFVNMTLNFTIYSIEEMTIAIQVFHLIEGAIPIQGKWDNWVNLTLYEGKNTFDNLTLVGENGYYENISDAFGDGGLLCRRNGIIEIRMMFPYQYQGLNDYTLLIDQIVMNFYVKKFASFL